MFCGCALKWRACGSLDRKPKSVASVSSHGRSVSSYAWLSQMVCARPEAAAAADPVSVAGLQGEVTASVWDGAHPRPLWILCVCLLWLLSRSSGSFGAHVLLMPTCKWIATHNISCLLLCGTQKLAWFQGYACLYRSPTMAGPYEHPHVFQPAEVDDELLARMRKADGRCDAVGALASAAKLFNTSAPPSGAVAAAGAALGGAAAAAASQVALPFCEAVCSCLGQARGRGLGFSGAALGAAAAAAASEMAQLCALTCTAI